MQKIKFISFSNGLGFYANCNGHEIGEITFVRVGIDKLIIDHTIIDDKYRDTGVGLNLVRCVCNMARQQHRKIISLCPFARSIFVKYPEFDDVLLINAH